MESAQLCVTRTNQPRKKLSSCYYWWYSSCYFALLAGQCIVFHGHDTKRTVTKPVSRLSVTLASQGSSAVATTFGAKVFGSFAWIVPVGVACSTFGSSNGEAFTSARLVYAAGGNGHFPRFLAYLR